MPRVCPVSRHRKHASQDSFWEVQAQLVVASAAVLETMRDEDRLGEWVATLVSTISVRIDRNTTEVPSKYDQVSQLIKTHLLLFRP